MTQTAPSLLLLIPAYNEEHRIEPVLRDYAEYFLKNYHGKFQLVVVLNGCVDDTIGVVRRVARDYACISALEIPDPIGKGGALIEGLKLAPLADLIGYVDADGATARRCLPRPAAIFRQGRMRHWLPLDAGLSPAPVTIQQTPVRQPRLSRHRAILFRMNVRDTQCGAKVMHRTAVEKVHASLRITDMAFDINLLYALKRAGLPHPRSADGMDRQDGFQSSAGPDVAQHVVSAVRTRLVYSPLHPWLRLLRPVETWIYKKLKAPVPLSRTEMKRKG